jgi:hypothetical protein
MAIIYSFPEGTPTLSDTVLGTQFDNNGNSTKSFSISDIIALVPSTAGFVPYTGATQSVDLGAFSLTANSVTTTIDSIISGLTIGRGSGNLATNTVVGNLALNSNTTGTSNTVVGNGALKTNTTGWGNTAIGIDALSLNTTGTQNHAIGRNALLNNTTGTENCAFGRMALNFNTTGSGNVAIGNGALFVNSTGTQNIAVGLGAGGVTTGNFNILIGYTAKPQLSTDSNSVVIGDAAIGVGSNTVVLGNTSITTTRLRGAVQGGSFVKDGGTASQYLMADGSVTTSGPLFKAANNISGTGVISAISPAIVGSLFPDGSILRIQTMVTFGPSANVNITPVTYYINTSPSLVGATQIATFDISAGQQYSWMDRSFWSIANTFNARNFLNSSQTSVSNSGTALGSTSIPATFYIIASMNVGVGDLGTIASILIEKQ